MRGDEKHFDKKKMMAEEKLNKGKPADQQTFTAKAEYEQWITLRDHAPAQPPSTFSGVVTVFAKEHASKGAGQKKVQIDLAESIEAVKRTQKLKRFLI